MVSTVVRMRMHAQGAVVLVPAVLSYDADEPYEVHAVFRAGPGAEAEWVLARSLLAAAFTFTPAPDTTGGLATCYACAADPAGQPCPRCGGTGHEPQFTSWKDSRGRQ